MGEVPPDAVRRDVREWVAGHWDEDLTVREWWQLLADAGWSQPTWPAGLGGRDLAPASARVVTQELAAAGAVAPPVGIGTRLAAPTLLQHGTREQHERYLPRIANGVELWCQLFSEPGAGSDLASLGTRAVRDGNCWVITGQKVWNSSANEAQRGLLLARTNLDVPKHQGITYFAFDMDQPGVEARPLRQMDGTASFCEVFIDGARVCADDIVGSLDGGWSVTKTTLAFERKMVGDRPARGLHFVPAGSIAGHLERRVGDIVHRPRTARRSITGAAVPARRLIELAREQERDADPVMRQRLAAYYCMTEVNRLTSLRAQAARAGRGRPGPEGSLTKLAIANICRASRDLSLTLLGAGAMLTDDDAPYDGALQRLALGSFGTSIGGGTDEIQRTVVGEQALGLPREPAVDRDVTYRDLKVGTQVSSEKGSVTRPPR